MKLIERGTTTLMVFSGEYYKACSQALYFLFKVRPARVIKNKPQGMNEKKNTIGLDQLVFKMK